MLPARRAPPPLRIDRWRPVALAGVEVARFTCEGRLFSSVKDRVATVHTTAGHGELWAHGRVWPSGPEAVHVKLPGELHRDLRRVGPARFQVVLFDDALLDEARQALDRDRSPPSRVALDVASPAGAALAVLHQRLDEGAEPLALETALAEGLAALVGFLASPRSPSRLGTAAVRRALALLDERLADPVTLDELAAHARLDKFHLSRAFREHVGLPPYAYLTHRRIARAQALLAAGVAPSDVAVRVGLYDQSQLNRHFKRIVGITPGQYARG
jgi:AraC-like DNA-binding protein